MKINLSTTETVLRKRKKRRGEDMRAGTGGRKKKEGDGK